MIGAPLWVIEAAEGFWQAAGSPAPFPRDLRGPIAAGLPLSVVPLPRLSVAGFDTWLRCQGLVCAIAGHDRALRACLVARRGQGLLFIDVTDPEEEVRFSLAHELAHFLRHYRQRRQDACEQLGPEVLEVLDGDRPPSRAERAYALLAGMQIGYFVHLMERGRGGVIEDGAVATAEQEADRLAYELLAPAERLADEARRDPPGRRHDALAHRLCVAYGLPAGQAARYAGLLAPRPRQAESFLSSLRAVR